MEYEVEQKFRVDELGSIEDALRQLGSRVEDTVEQVDCYFAHPVRDFAATDEALRIRQVGPDAFVTYKGPKIDSWVSPAHAQPTGSQAVPSRVASIGFVVIGRFLLSGQRP